MMPLLPSREKVTNALSCTLEGGGVMIFLSILTCVLKLFELFGIYLTLYYELKEILFSYFHILRTSYYGQENELDLLYKVLRSIFIINFFHQLLSVVSVSSEILDMNYE